MARNLNEYCLHHINSFLKPHDWVQVSKVCKLWQLVTSRRWKTITTVGYLGSNREVREDPGDENATIVSAVDAGKLVLSAAPLVEVLEIFDSIEQTSPLRYFSVGQFYYGAENFELKNMLNLLAKKSTKLKEVYFETTPEANLIKDLFERNDITRMSFTDKSKHGWYRDISSDTIEELFVTFSNINAELVPLQKCFPNLKKLSLTVEYIENKDPKNILSQILPHVSGLKCLKLKVDCFNAPGSYSLLSDLTNLPDLEELIIDLMNYDIESPELFFNQLPTCCPKLRVLRLRNDAKPEKESIKRLLSLPHLKVFECRKSFPHNELPEMEHISKLIIRVDCEDPLFTGLLEAIRTMHCLKELMIDYCDEIKKIQLLHLVCGVVKVATSLGKDVIVSIFPDLLDGEYVLYEKLKISKSDEHETAEEVFKLALCDFLYDVDELCEGIAMFVRNMLLNYEVVQL